MNMLQVTETKRTNDAMAWLGIAKAFTWVWAIIGVLAGAAVALSKSGESSLMVPGLGIVLGVMALASVVYGALCFMMAMLER
jgi:1,4-dihydroxy-2-naphthoate octaprenyltransferase